MSHLVIVESPAKARTIGQYLGGDYTVKATMGHVRDLPKSGIGVDVKNDFELNYQISEGKDALISELKKLAKSSETVYLATDPDREGEAISWHLKELLGLKNEQAKRVTFNEITKKEVLSSIQQPRAIDDQLVDAQQARRALDRIVGYEISPVLWRKIKTGLSAGRVQSVATRLVVDREDEIRAFKADEYWTIEVSLKRLQGAGTFTAKYFAPVGKKAAELGTEAEADAIINAVTHAPFAVHSISHNDKRRSPAPPFTTSTLQQEASRRHSMSPKRTMAIAQQLYEGIEVPGHGLTGLITYMRTDSLRLSDDAVTDARNYIAKTYGENHLPKAPKVYKTKAGAQDAHEAIRPSYIDLPPDSVRAHLSPEQYKLYKLIWDRFISCQMENAVFDVLTIDTVSAGEVFRANHTTVKFAGFTAVYEEGKDDSEEEVGVALPNLAQGEALGLENILPHQHFTKPPARYTEASLIRAMEEKGVGRPSTYAPTISTITDREYVVREAKQLRPTPLGETVTRYMLDKFTDIVDVAFTARMENELDEVEDGKKRWKTMLGEFYGEFSQSVKTASEDTNRVKVPDEETNFVCDVCGRKMVVKLGRFGRYMACEGYPDECKNTKPVAEETEGICPLCSGKILKKKSKKGYAYYGCEKSPACGFMTWGTPQKTNCEQCGNTLFKPRYSKVGLCENPQCSAYIPEDARGYKKKETTEGAESTDSKKPASKAASTKTTAKKTTAKTPAKTEKSATKTAKPKAEKTTAKSDTTAAKTTKPKTAAKTAKPKAAPKTATKTATKAPAKKAAKKTTTEAND